VAPAGAVPKRFAWAGLAIEPAASGWFIYRLCQTH